MSCQNCRTSFETINGAGSFVAGSSTTLVKVNVVSGPATINGSPVSVGCYELGNGVGALGYFLEVTGLIGSEISIMVDECGIPVVPSPFIGPVAVPESVACTF